MFKVFDKCFNIGVEGEYIDGDEFWFGDYLFSMRFDNGFFQETFPVGRDPYDHRFEFTVVWY